jgi:hypothetical protein
VGEEAGAAVVVAEPVAAVGEEVEVVEAAAVVAVVAVVAAGEAN